MTHSRVRPGPLLRALVACGLLIGLVVVTPVALWKIVGWPLPGSLPSWESLRRPIPDEVLLNALTVVWWAAWAQLVVCLAAEVMAFARGRRASRLPGSATMQRLASWLVTSLMVVGSSPALRAASLPHQSIVMVHREPVAATASPTTAVADLIPTSKMERPTYTVVRRDTLWGIAARHLGNPERWPEIFELNRGRTQPDGGTLDDPRRLPSGWRLILPADAAGLAALSEVVVAPGDTLSEIAEEHLGDEDRWAEVFELNRNRVQKAGGTLADPNLIRPGWTIRLPAEPKSTASVPAAPVDASAPAAPVDSPRPAPTLPDVTNTTPPPAPAPPAPTGNGTTMPVPSTPPADPGSSGHNNDASPAPIGLLGAGLAAGGVVLALDQLRRARQRHRAPGRCPAPPAETTASAEQSLRLTAEEQHADIDRLDVALRALGERLGQRGGPAPTILALQLGGEGLELLLGNPSNDPPEGFVSQDDGWAWTIAADAIDGLSPAAGAVAPLPALVSVGSGDGGNVLVDLETAGSLELVGDRKETRRLLAGFALELATSSWADHLDVILVGPGLPEIPALQHARRVATIDEVITELEERSTALARDLKTGGLSSTFAGRIRTDGTESWSPTIVLCSDVPKTSKVADRLVALAGNGGQGIAVVVDGCLPGARWGFTCSAGSVSMSPLNLRVRSAAPAEEDVAAVETMLEEHDVEASEVYEAEAEAESVGPGPVPGAAEGQPDGESVEQAPTAEDLAIPDSAAPAEPPVAPTELDLRASPHELAQPPRPFQPGTYDIEVRVLGPVEIVGGDRPVEPGKPTEVVVYLATHPAGVDSDRLRTALWPRNKLPAPKTFSNAVSKARLALGARHLPHAANERYRLEPTVTTDLARFEAMARYAHRQQGPAAIDTLRAALELVRGAPYTAVHGFHWAPSEGFVGHAEATVVDVAHRLAQLCLEAGDPGGAEWAAHHGLLAAPGNEALFRDRMEAAYAAGDPARVEAVMDELCDFIEGGNPYDTLHPDTIVTYEKLSKRHRHKAASG